MATSAGTATSEHDPPPTQASSLGSTKHVQKRRLLLLVRTGLTLAIGYLVIFSAGSKEVPPLQLSFVALYLGSNLVIAWIPARMLATAVFDVSLVLFDTAATSFALYLMPEANTDVFIFYFVIVLLASISDRLSHTLLAPVVTGVAYIAFLCTRYSTAELLEPAILLRIPFFLLAGAFYGFFVDSVRRGRLTAAAAQQREAARMEFLSLITHDLKQPLWMAKESAMMLHDAVSSGSSEKPRRLAGQVLVNLRRMEALAMNFLDLGRIETKGVRVFPQRASFNRILRDLVESYAPVFETKQLQVQLDMDPALPDTMVDPPQLERALSNLFDNAFKFSPQGGQILCKTRADGDAVVLSIADSGPGIDSEQAATLFSPFQNGQDRPGRPSTGLGLYITQAIINAHGGTVSLDPEQPGACFHIRLPVAQESSPGVGLVPMQVRERVA